jgi:hypothetical protein
MKVVVKITPIDVKKQGGSNGCNFKKIGAVLIEL